MKTTAPNSENLEVRSEKRDQDSSFSISNSHFSPHPPVLVPKLRFPEFRGEWRELTFGELLDDIIDFRGRTPVKLGMEWGNGNITSLSANNVKNGFIDYKAECNLGSEELYQRWMGDVRLEKDDIVFTMEAPLGNALLLPDSRKYILSQRVVAFKTKSQVVNPFLVQLIWSEGFQYAISELSTGSTAKGINQKALKTVPVKVPHPKEQQKIAECLSSVDELIAAQARKVDALKTHKKGLMQQLFPREGETQPRLRFPEFQNAGNWEEVILGDIAEIKLGKMLDKKKNTTGHLLPYLNNLAVRWNEVNTSDLPKMYFNDRELDRFGLKVGDVVVCEGGEPGRAAVWDGRLPDLKFQKAIHRVRFYEPFEPKILVLHLENLAGTTEFEMLFTGGGIKHLTGETFSRLKVPLIPHAEQKRIASSLNNLEALITAETQKLEALKTHKKGLMQQLFPSPEEALP